MQLQMVALVLSDSHVSPPQAERLLAVFNPKVSEQEGDRAGALLCAAVTDPLDFWLDVLPLLQPTARADMLAVAALMGRLDLGNPTGRCARPPPTFALLTRHLRKADLPAHATPRVCWHSVYAVLYVYLPYRTPETASGITVRGGIDLAFVVAALSYRTASLRWGSGFTGRLQRVADHGGRDDVALSLPRAIGSAVCTSRSEGKSAALRTGPLGLACVHAP